MHSKVIPLPTQQPSRFEHATVVGVGEGSVMVETPTGITAARTAVSCLLAPMKGDRVLLSRTGDECYLLAVLARANADRRLEVPGQLELAAEQVRVTARSSVALSAGEQLRLHSRQLRVGATDTALFSSRLDVSGHDAVGRFQRTRLLSDAVEVIGQRLFQSAQEVVRRVEKVELLRVGNLIQRIRHTWSSHAQRAALTARKDMRVDGERIHMG